MVGWIYLISALSRLKVGQIQSNKLPSTWPWPSLPNSHPPLNKEEQKKKKKTMKKNPLSLAADRGAAAVAVWIGWYFPQQEKYRERH